MWEKDEVRNSIQFSQELYIRYGTCLDMEIQFLQELYVRYGIGLSKECTSPQEL